MPKKRKFTSVDDKCRVCLGDDGCMSDIFSDDLKPKINDLGDSTSIYIDNDEKLPRNICHVCLYKLDMWIEFKKQFLRSNTMLHEHLGVGELSNNAASAIKRKRSESLESPKHDSPEDGAIKKLKSDEADAVTADRDRESCKEAKKALANGESITIEDTSIKNIAGNAVAAEQKIASDNETSKTLVGSPIKQLIGRRVKTTERRKASTKRWVARKKALLAATGENDTDTDSMSSDDGQSSSVQKARAKCNAEKNSETQRIVKTMKNLASDTSDYCGTKQPSESCIVGDADSEDRKKSVKTTRNDATLDDERGNYCKPSGNDIEEKNIISMESKKLLSSPVNKMFTDNLLPHSVRSELIIDDSTFIVTSTLVLTEPHNLHPVEVTKLSKDGNALTPDEANQERNTDIIDAVQLRRVCPKSTIHNDKRFVERCLNIEVEGTELESLKRVQSELANYVETELHGVLDTRASTKKETPSRESFQSLDQQLKTIVERSIKKNLEASRIGKSRMENRGDNTFTGEFVKAAMRSKIFQPRVLLVRCEKNINETTEEYNQPDDTRPNGKKSFLSSCQRSVNPISAVSILGKRRSVKPVKYADYDGSPFNTGSDEAGDTTKMLELSSGPRSRKFGTSEPASMKEMNTVPTSDQRRNVRKQSEIVRRESSPGSILFSDVEKILPSATRSLSIDEEISAIVAPTKNATTGEKHICGVCGESFGTRKEVEIHFSAHKTAIAASKQAKQKMMRCKRCHEIVEARYVKLHVCKTQKNCHKCYTCSASFRTDKLLVKHLESHSLEYEATMIDTTVPMRIDKEQDLTSTAKEYEKNNFAMAKKRIIGQLEGQTSETYTCFVCDKIFIDEEVLKDHLQKHCDDISEEDDDDDDDDDGEKEEEEEPGERKGKYQCAICGKSMGSEDALEAHVENHLFDDEDDNPDLISIGGVERDRGRNKNDEIIHECSQCTETFDSEMLLMLHMQAHEEEVAIAEWEKRGVDNSQAEQHICVICDELFATEDELSEHLDIHNGNAHVCLLCDKPFLTLEELQSHVDTH